MTAKEIITKFQNIGDAELSLADTQWLIQNIDKAINEAKNSSQPEPPDPQKIAEEFEHKFVFKYILSSDGWTWKNKDMHYNEIIEFINTKLREVSNFSA